jgi:hypothetical protein
MGRNYFSKYGGPYFINDGFTHHVKPQSQLEPEEYIKPSPNLFYGLTIGFVSLILGVGITLFFIA